MKGSIINWKRVGLTVFSIVTLFLCSSFMLTRSSLYTVDTVKYAYWVAPPEVHAREKAREKKFIKFATRIIKKHNPNLSDRETIKIAHAIYKNAVKYGYDPYFILSIVKVESSFDPHAVSPVGAMGLMQIMPAVGKYLAEEKGIKLKNINELFDINTNLDLGVFYLRFLHRYYKNIKMALLAYNMGPGNLNFFLNKGKFPNNDYHKLVLKFYSKVKRYKKGDL